MRNYEFADIEGQQDDRSLDPYELLACAIIRQAVDDAIELPVKLKSPTINKYKRRALVEALDSAKVFLETDSLNNFISESNLSLNADFVRNTYKKIARF